jgi:hypothetical protein
MALPLLRGRGRGRFGLPGFLVSLASFVCSSAALAQDVPPPAAFTPGVSGEPAPVGTTTAPLPENDPTLRDPFDARLTLDLPGLDFRALDAGSAAPSLLGVAPRRTATTLAGVRISSLLLRDHDEPYFSHLTNGPLRLVPFAGPDAAALRGDALGGTIDLVPPDPPADPYRPTVVDGGGRLGFAGDVGGLAGHLRAGLQVERFQLTASFAGAALGLSDGLSVDDSRMGEALGGLALFDLRVPLTDEDVLRMLLRLDGATGLVRGGNLGRGFLRTDDVGGTLLEALYRHGPVGPGSVTAWAEARTSERSLSAFDTPAGRWSRSDESLWALAAGLDVAFGERWWTLDLTGELRAEGVGAALSRGFAAGGDTYGDLLGDWPYRPVLDGSNRAGGSLGVAAGFRAGEDVDLRAAAALSVYRLFLPLDPFGQETPERYGETEAWEVEPAADFGVDWRIGEGLGLDARFETGARPADVTELATAGVDPAAGIRWIPAYDLQPERSYGGQVGFRLELGIVDLRLAYHAQWIDDAITAVTAAEEVDGVLTATWSNTEEFVQGGTVSGTVYLHRDWPMRFVIESSLGWASNGGGGDYNPIDVAPFSALLEFAYRPQDEGIEAGVYGGYRYRPDSWELSPVDERLARACSLDAVRCAARDRAPLGLYVRWSFWETLALLVRAGGLSFQGDGPSVQGFLSGSF